MAAKKKAASGEIKLKKPLPYAFVLEEITALNPYVRAMFGAHAIYVGEAIVLIMRQKLPDPTKDNGVWVATTAEHHESLRRELPSLRSISLLGEAPTNWQCLPESGAGFEAEVMRVCELVRKRDPRVGKIPQRKKPKKKAAPKKADRKRG
jgi:hypothetical protein